MSTDSTLSLEELVQRAAALRGRAGTLGEYLDPPTLEKRVAELEAQMGAPGFWDDQANAAAVSSAHAAAGGRLTQYRELSDEIASLAEIADLLREEERAGDPDSDMLGELAEGIARADGVLASLEEARLFSGEHDTGDAVVQINAGEGGTDA
jgi:peptide chain release factor 2